MFARKFRLNLAEGEQSRPVPKQWMDQFFMRNFIGLSEFDETLVTGEGELEAGFAVTAEQIQEHFEKWLRGRKLIRQDAVLEVRTQ